MNVIVEASGGPTLTSILQVTLGTAAGMITAILIYLVASALSRWWLR